MTKKQKEELTRKLTKLLRVEWGTLFTDEDVARIHDFCHDEAEDIIGAVYPFSTNDILTLSSEFERKHG